LSAPIIPAGSLAPHRERTRVSADVQDRPMPKTNRATGRAALPVCAAGAVTNTTPCSMPQAAQKRDGPP
jgi:hypothetical protein